MNILAEQLTIPAMSQASIAHARDMEAVISSQPQISIPTQHIIHAGVYARTVLIPKGVTVAGVVVKRTSCLIICGHVTVFIGDDKAKEFKGYNLLTTDANRKQVFVAHEDTYLTMLFATRSQNIHDAENEFTDDGEFLMSRKSDSLNEIIITES